MSRKNPKSTVERKAEERARKRKAGFVLWQIWIKPEWKAPIRQIIETLGADKS